MCVISILMHELKQLRVQDLEKHYVQIIVMSQWHQRNWRIVAQTRELKIKKSDHVYCYLYEWPHVGEMSVHSSSGRKILTHSFHELSETAVGQALFEVDKEKIKY